jgi:hypothetical protein
MPDIPGGPYPGTDNIDLDDDFAAWLDAVAEAAAYAECEIGCHLGLDKFKIPKCPHLVKDGVIITSCGQLCDYLLEKMREFDAEKRAERRLERYKQDRGEV